MATFEDKVWGLLSLCARARKLISGNFSTEKAIQNYSAQLVIVASDASENTKNKFINKCNYYEIPCRIFGTGDELGRRIGKESRVTLAILDEGFANQIINKLDSNIDMEV